MERIGARSWASKLAESFQNDSYENAEHGVLGLTADEADLLEPLRFTTYEPWVVPLTIRPNGAPNDTANAGAHFALAPDWNPITRTEAERNKGQAWGLKTIESLHTHGTPPPSGLGCDEIDAGRNDLCEQGIAS